MLPIQSSIAFKKVCRHDLLHGKDDDMRKLWGAGGPVGGSLPALRGLSLQAHVACDVAGGGHRGSADGSCHHHRDHLLLKVDAAAG
jgi:hypothetical protein